jgi:hypothetical protein
MALRVTIKQLKRMISESIREAGYNRVVEHSNVPFDTEISLNQLKAIAPKAAQEFLDNEAEVLADPDFGEQEPTDPDGKFFMVATEDNPLFELQYAVSNVSGRKVCFLYFDQNGFTNETLYWDGMYWGG